MTGVFEGVGSLQYTPDNKYAYWYSGEFTATADTALAGEFKTESEYLVGEVRIAGYFDAGSPESGAKLAARVMFSDIAVADVNTNNDKVIAILKCDGGDEDAPAEGFARIVIPPFTKVQIFRDSNTTSTSVDGTISFIAKVKGAIQQQTLEAVTDASDWVK